MRVDCGNAETIRIDEEKKEIRLNPVSVNGLLLPLPLLKPEPDTDLSRSFCLKSWFLPYSIIFQRI